jgi:hypothetical protein
VPKTTKNAISIYVDDDTLAWIDTLRGPTRAAKIVGALEEYRNLFSSTSSNVAESSLVERLNQLDDLIKRVQALEEAQ